MGKDNSHKGSGCLKNGCSIGCGSVISIFFITSFFYNSLNHKIDPYIDQFISGARGLSKKIYSSVFEESVHYAGDVQVLDRVALEKLSKKDILQKYIQLGGVYDALENEFVETKVVYNRLYNKNEKDDLKYKSSMEELQNKYGKLVEDYKKLEAQYGMAIKELDEFGIEKKERSS
jgi:hypothetical protein